MSADLSRKHQDFLKQFETTLLEQEDLGPELRQRLLAEFDEALTQAEHNPTDVALTLANWKETVANLNSLLNAPGEQQLSATEANDLFRNFDEVTQTLQGLQDRQSAGDAETRDADGSSSPLPQGMPADLAAKLGR